MKHILVCGGREFSDRELLYRVLDRALYLYEDITIIEGGARGADRLAQQWAKERNVPVITCPADWNKHGKAAGVLRNQQMLDDHNPSLTIAFAGGIGTRDMIRRSEKAGLKVIKVF